MAVHFSCPFILEYAREYLENRPGYVYKLSDLDLIARKQVAQTRKAISAKPNLLFCDTDLITIKIWAQEKCNAKLHFVEDALKNNTTHFYLLCAPNIIWEEDVLREDKNNRDYLFEENRKALEAQNAPYQIISDLNEERLKQAILHVEDFLTP